MKATELRIGNWHTWSQVDCFGEDIIYFDVQLEAKHFTSKTDIGTLYISLIEPIPLDEKWLKKFPKGLVLPNWIKYVHQAQNWYYWNNQQKELKIK